MFRQEICRVLVYTFETLLRELIQLKYDEKFYKINYFNGTCPRWI